MKRFLKPSIIIPLVLLVVLAAAAWQGRQWWQQVDERIQVERGIVQQLSAIRQQEPWDIDFAELETLAAISETNLGELREQLRPLYPAMRRLAGLPRVGPYLAQVEPTLQYGIEVSRLGGRLAQLAAPFAELYHDKADGVEMVGKAVKKLEEVTPWFEPLQEQIDVVQQERTRLDDALWPENYRRQVGELDEGLLLLEDVMQQAPPLLSALGAGEPKSYLIMVQNRDEIRASGGFITALGMVRLDTGRITMLGMQDSTKLDYVSEVRLPPEPMAYIMEANYWVPRDANWSPDFPTAARQTQEIYRLATGLHTDGAIAFDEELLVTLLAFTGPVEIPGEKLQVDSGNIAAQMVRYRDGAIEQGQRDERKDFMLLLAPVLMEKAAAVHDVNAWRGLLQQMLALVKEGHLLFYANDDDVQALVSRYGLDGAVAPGMGDYLLLVDSNVGIGKIDRFIERSLRYEVDLRDAEQPRGSIRVRYVHTQPGDEPCYQGVSLVPGGSAYTFSRCYWDYWRVYLAQGTQLEDWQVVEVPASYFVDGVGWQKGVEEYGGENGTQVAAALAVVQQDSTQQFTLQTAVSPLAVQQMENGSVVYRLRVSKQAGLAKLPVELLVRAPQGKEAAALSEGWQEGDESVYTWQGDVTLPLDVQLEFVDAE